MLLPRPEPEPRPGLVDRDHLVVDEVALQASAADDRLREVARRAGRALRPQYPEITLPRERAHADEVALDVLPCGREPEDEVAPARGCVAEHRALRHVFDREPVRRACEPDVRAWLDAELPRERDALVGRKDGLRRDGVRRRRGDRALERGP